MKKGDDEVESPPQSAKRARRNREVSSIVKLAGALKRQYKQDENPSHGGAEPGEPVLVPGTLPERPSTPPQRPISSISPFKAPEAPQKEMPAPLLPRSVSPASNPESASATPVSTPMQPPKSALDHPTYRHTPPSELVRKVFRLSARKPADIGWRKGKGGVSFYLDLKGRKLIGKAAFNQSKRDLLLLNSDSLNPFLGTKASSSCPQSPVPTPELKNLSQWGLPEKVVDSYRSIGISELHEWQVQCLHGNPAAGKSLVFVAPTSGGKTLVAELLILRYLRVAEHAKAIFVVPFVSLVTEKVKHLKNVWKESSITIEGFCGGRDGSSLGVDLAVATIEKAGQLVNAMLEDGTIADLKVLVVDEVHLLGEGSRGCILESMLLKIRMLGLSTQIVAMSATLPNSHDLARWLHSNVFQNPHRPVPLREMVCLDKKFFEVISTPAGTTLSDVSGEFMTEEIRATATSKEEFVQLALRTVRDNHSCLVFCPSKIGCQKTAWDIARKILNPGSTRPIEVSREFRDQRQGLIFDLQRTAAGLCGTLKRTIPAGVVYHHAGLTLEERELIEDAYKRSVVRICVATSTLAAGVNLPAHCVIINRPYVGRTPLSAIKYKQMCGRAGRVGLDKKGESFLFVDGSVDCRNIAINLVKSGIPPVLSTLTHESQGMARPLLETIALEIVRNTADLRFFASKSLLAYQQPFEVAEKAVVEAFLFLKSNALIRCSPDIDASQCRDVTGESILLCKIPRCSLFATQLGMAAQKSGLAPQEAVVVMRDLEIARPKLLLDTDLQLVYQITPVYHKGYPYWGEFYRLYCDLPVAEKRAARALRIDVSKLRQFQDTGTFKGEVPEKHVLERFYFALAVHMLIHDVPICVVEKRMKIDRGQLQSLQSATSSFAAMVVGFCEQLQWLDLAMLFSKLLERVSFAASEELLPLMRIPGLISQRAKTLFNAGMKSVESVADCDVETLCGLFLATKQYDAASEQSKASAMRLATRTKAAAVKALEDMQRERDFLARVEAKE